MNFHVLTLFPEMIEQGMNTSIIGQGDANRDTDFSETHQTSGTMLRTSIIRWMITPYGGGAGMVMQAAAGLSEPMSQYRSRSAIVRE